MITVAEASKKAPVSGAFYLYFVIPLSTDFIRIFTGMSPPSDISYMNEPVREARSTPSGWLVAPTRDFILLFIRDPKSVMVSPTVFTQLWFCTEEGIPTRLKNTRRLDYQCSSETWNELISNGWELVDHQFNACVEA